MNCHGWIVGLKLRNLYIVCGGLLPKNEHRPSHVWEWQAHKHSLCKALVSLTPETQHGALLRPPLLKTCFGQFSDPRFAFEMGAFFTRTSLQADVQKCNCAACNAGSVKACLQHTSQVTLDE